MILKEGKDAKGPKSYRPISLINNDYKILTSVLAERLKTILEERIHTDQNGFLAGRQINGNIRTVIDILEYYNLNREQKFAMLFTDSEKAYGNRSWECMYNLLEKIQVGETFLKWRKEPYKDERASSVIVNGGKSEGLVIQKGRRQGWPLCPLLYIMITEVLWQSIRQNEKIQGVRIKG